MGSRLAGVLVAVALTGLTGGCGADDEPSTDIPRTSPDLTIPTATTDLGPADVQTDTMPTTGTAPGSDPSAAQPPAAATPPATPPAAAPPVATTGGAGAPSDSPSTSTTGGAQAGDSEFKSFCSDNQGAC